MALEALDNSENSNLTNPLSSLSKVDPTQQKIIDAQDELTKLIGNRGGGTPWFRLASGFLKPTRSGSFGESVGNAAEGMANYQEEQQKQEIPLAQAKIGLLQSQYNTQQEQAKKQFGSQLYKTIIDPETKTSRMVIDPEAAKNYVGVGGDPSILKQAAVELQQQNLTKAQSKLFSPQLDSKGEQIIGADGKPKYQVNFGAIPEIIQHGGMEEANKAQKSIIDARKSGLVGNMEELGTPYDSILMMIPDPGLQAIMKKNALMVKNGMLDQDEARKDAEKIYDNWNSRQDKKSQEANNAQMRMLTYNLAVSQADFNKWAKEQSINKDKEILSGKLTDQQKVDYKNVVQPTLAEAQKVPTALQILDRMEKLITDPNTPNDAISATQANTIGKYTNSNAYQNLTNLQQEQSLLKNYLPRLPGRVLLAQFQNIEKEGGSLADTNKDVKTRLSQIKTIRDLLSDVTKHANEVGDYWETNKKVMPIKMPDKNEKSTPTQSLGSGTWEIKQIGQ